MTPFGLLTTSFIKGAAEPYARRRFAFSELGKHYCIRAAAGRISDKTKETPPSDTSKCSLMLVYRLLARPTVRRPRPI